MSATVNQSAKIIWLIEYSSDNIWLLELLLGKWGYDAVRMGDSEALAFKIDSQPLPSLIILNIAPLQPDVLKLVRNFRQHSTLQYIPLLCLCPTVELCQSQVMAAGAKDVINKPFELEELHHRLQRLWGGEVNIQPSSSRPEMTLLVSETESSSLFQQHQYWSKVFQQYSEPKVWKMLTKAGYEIFK